MKLALKLSDFSKNPQIETPTKHNNAKGQISTMTDMIGHLLGPWEQTDVYTSNINSRAEYSGHLRSTHTYLDAVL